MVEAKKALVNTALKRYRTIAAGLRYGGLWADWKLAQQALDALDDIGKPKQPALFKLDDGARGE